MTDAGTAAAAPDMNPDPRRMRAIALLAASTMFMESLDGTIVAIAIPTMARHFRTDSVTMNLGMTAYLVALSILLPLSNWAADRWGPRSTFAIAVGLFTISSLACAASDTLSMFVISRLVQGASAAMMTPVGRSVVLANTQRAGMMNAVALLTWPALIAPAIAPPLGGLIIQYLSWQWIFLINLPLGVVGVAAAVRLLPAASHHPVGHDRGSVDVFGAIIWALAAAMLVGGVESAPRMSYPILVLVLAAGCLLLAFAWRHFSRTRRPLLDVELVARHQSFAVAIIEGSGFRAAIMGLPFLLPLYLQVGLGLSISTTGILIMIGMSGNIGMKFVTSFVLRRAGFKRVLIINGLILGSGLLAFMGTDRHTSLVTIAFLLVATGLARSMQFTTLNTVAFADVPQRRAGAANTVMSTAIQINGAMGVAIVAMGVQIGSHLFGASSTAAFHVAFGMIAAISIASALSCLRLQERLGSSLTSHTIEMPAEA